MNGRLFVVSTLALVWSVAGCGGTSSGPTEPDPSPTPTSSGMLKPVTTPDQLRESLLTSLLQISDPGPTPVVANDQLAAPVDEAAAFTTTYTQEVEVDEMDVVKYDGETMYVAPIRGYFGCCFPLAQDAIEVLNPSPGAPHAIRVLRTDAPAASAELIATIPLASGETVQGLYLHDEKLVALTTNAFHGRYGSTWGAPDIWSNQTTGMTVYDVSEPATPVLAWRAAFDGGFVQTRRIGDVVYLISRHTPFVDELQNAGTITDPVAIDVTIEDLLPKTYQDNTSRPLVLATDCFVTRDNPGFGYPVVTTITAIPLSDPGAHRSVCYNEEAYGVYVSADAVYLYQAHQNAVFAAGATRIHKFRLDATAIVYAGSAEVTGYLWTNGQADFRASESDGYLRVLTSSYPATNADMIDHHLFVLRESPTQLALEVVGELPNERRPQEIGKPNESLYGVRFLNDRAYAVTFRQIDPLYVIDLGDPQDPFIAGELTVPGFSDFLHPVSDELLLGLGQSEGGGVKLELFDVMDLANPRPLGSHVIGGPGSSSEAQWDRHAFTYQAKTESVDRFAVPADVYSESGNFTWVESGLFLFEIRDKDRPELATLTAVGSIIAERSSATQTWPIGFRNRAIFHDDTVFFLRDESVWSTFWGQDDVANGPF
ncbi:MAG: beta-propeller domain-containing protein [Proteobacteria bacterium]|nr:beta-propeller domain-containing protein [Pseudomonadota bacterium]